MEQEVKKNRKQRRFEAKLARQRPKPKRDPYHWHKRIIKEMKDNKHVTDKVVNGELDKYLG